MTGHRNQQIHSSHTIIKSKMWKQLEVKKLRRAGNGEEKRPHLWDTKTFTRPR